MTETTKPYQLDFNKLTLGEVDFIEQHSHLTMTELADLGKPGVPMGKAMIAIAVIVKRRTGHPEFSIKEARALEVEEIENLFEIDSEE